MARDADGVFDILSKWASSGDTAVPPFAYVDGWALAYSQSGAPYPQRTVFNLLYMQLFALGIDINKMGAGLEYSATPDYVVGATTFGTDGISYKAYIANGPASSVVSPVGDATGTWCYANNPAPGTIALLTFEPSATQKAQMRILEANGANLLDADYPDLLTAWGSKIYDNADGTHFYAPTYSGKFLRAWDNGTGNDPGAAVAITGDTHSNTTIDNIADTSILEVDMLIAGTDMPAGAHIDSIDSGTAITISSAATGTTVGAALTCTNRTDRGDGTTGDEVGTDQAGISEGHDHPSSANLDPAAEQGVTAGGVAVAAVGDETGLYGGLDNRPLNAYVFAGVYY